MTVPSMSGTTFTVGSNLVQYEIDHGSGIIWLGYTTEIPELGLSTETDADLVTVLPELHHTTQLFEPVLLTSVPDVHTLTKIPALDIHTIMENDD